ncbi:hypothetical protein [Bacillus sp. S1-R1J2-FB]|nr:hypothetical protein [Bacillus sp. S1-R1J2-FB]
MFDSNATDLLEESTTNTKLADDDKFAAAINGFTKVFVASA